MKGLNKSLKSFEPALPFCSTPVETKKASLFSEAFYCEPTGTELEPFIGRLKAIEPIER